MIDYPAEGNVGAVEREYEDEIDDVVDPVKDIDESLPAPEVEVEPEREHESFFQRIGSFFRNLFN